MAKLYTLDNKLLVATPEIRIGEKVYPVDNRQKTVKKIMQIKMDGDQVDESMDNTLTLAFGPKVFKEIDALDLPFPAYQKLFELVMAAVTGEEPEEVSARFQGENTSK